MTFNQVICKQICDLQRIITFNGDGPYLTHGEETYKVSDVIIALETDNELGIQLKSNLRLLNEDLIKRGKEPLYTDDN